MAPINRSEFTKSPIWHIEAVKPQPPKAPINRSEIEKSPKWDFGLQRDFGL
jgi:hypothetical protein